MVWVITRLAPAHCVGPPLLSVGSPRSSLHCFLPLCGCPRSSQPRCPVGPSLSGVPPSQHVCVILTVRPLRSPLPPVPHLPPHASFGVLPAWHHCDNWPRVHGPACFLLSLARTFIFSPSDVFIPPRIVRTSSSAGAERLFSAAGRAHHDLKGSINDSSLEHELLAMANTE